MKAFLMAAILVGTEWAAGAQPAIRKVTVCLEAGWGPIGQARVIASEIFAGIDIKLEWHGWNVCPAEGLRISLSDRTAEAVRPGALAYAMPYEGTHIVVFQDRVEAVAGKDKVAALLAHVMVHEITHILQGLCRHSATGLMKAHWDVAEMNRMSCSRLQFTADDIELIYVGMARRGELRRSLSETERAELR